MAEYPTEPQIDEAKEFIRTRKKEDLDKDIKSGKGFYGFFEGLEKPPGKGAKPKDLLDLLSRLKSIKPFFRDKEPEMTPLVNYFYCRYMASWIRQSGIAAGSLDVTKHLKMDKRGNALDRYKTYCSLINDVYGAEDVDFLERLFPFDRVATTKDEEGNWTPGMLQKQYGMLRAEERKKFRALASKIKIPVRSTDKDKKEYGLSVAYYLKEYLKEGTTLNNFNRNMPIVLDRTTDSPTFLEAGAYLVATGLAIEMAEKEGYEAILKYKFGDEPPESNSKEELEFEAEEYTLQYMPSANDEDESYSHYLLEPDEDDPVSVYLKNSQVFATKGGKKWKQNNQFRWVSEGLTFLPPNPKEYKSFEALGNLVEAQMAHFATTASETKDRQPDNSFEEIHRGLLGTKNKPGIAVYHANIFYHLLLAQARDPIANFNAVDENIFSAGRLISLEAYTGKPLKILSYWMMTYRNYVEFKGIDPKTETPRIVAPQRLSVSQAIVDETAKAEMTNALSKLQIAYYRCLFGMLKNKSILYPATLSAPRQKKDELGKEAKKAFSDYIDLNKLWEDLLTDVETKGFRNKINPTVMSKIIDYMYNDGNGVISYPASMDPEIGKKTDGWGVEDIAKWLKFSYAANPTSIDTFIECSSAIYASIGMTGYLDADGHVEGVKRFLETVDGQGGYHYLIGILSEGESDALPNAESFRPTGVETYMPPRTKNNPAKKKKEAVLEQEYIVNIELELPVEIDLQDEENATKQFDRIDESLSEAGIDEPAHIGTNGKTLDMGWYIFGLEEAIELLSDVTEIYSQLGMPGRGWLEWGQEELREKYTVDGYSFDDI